MNFFKNLITFAAILLCATAIFGQERFSGPDNGLSTPPFGPVRPDPRANGTPASGDTLYVAPGAFRGPLKINQKLEDKLKTLLPQNVTPKAAAVGFLELRDFVAVVRAANNLSVPFWDLRHAMTNGSTEGLEKAIHKLKPDVTAKDEVKKAKDQAKEDIKESKKS